MYLSCDNEVGKHHHGGPKGEEVGDWFHDIPRIFPPGEASKEAKLERQICKAPPHPQVGVRV